MRCAFIVLLLSTTVLERFGLNFGSYSLNAAMLGMYGFLAVAAFSGVLLVSVTRLALYGGCVALAILSAAFNPSRTSLPSMLLLAAIYWPYTFVLTAGTSLDEDPRWIARTFLNITFFAAIAGIVQFYAQFLIHSEWLFDFTAYVPAVLRGPAGFNTVIPVGALHKANGFFFHEPSGFSFLMALALIVEHVSFRRLHRFACFGFALLLTYSGTGLVVLLLGTLFPLGQKTVARLLILAGMGALVLWFLGDTLNLSFTLGRVAEFGAERSSGYIRYIAPLRLVRDTIGSDPWTPWIGHGPGTISRAVEGYEFFDPTWAKMLFEYGIVGFVMVTALFLIALRRRETPAQVRAAMFFAWLITGSNLLCPELNFLTLAIVGLLPRQPRVAAMHRPESGGLSTLPAAPSRA